MFDTGSILAVKLAGAALREIRRARVMLRRSHAGLASFRPVREPGGKGAGMPLNRTSDIQGEPRCRFNP
jgi:hypothetical protein